MPTSVPRIKNDPVTQLGYKIDDLVRRLEEAGVLPVYVDVPEPEVTEVAEDVAVDEAVAVDAAADTAPVPADTDETGTVVAAAPADGAALIRSDGSGFVEPVELEVTDDGTAGAVPDVDADADVSGDVDQPGGAEVPDDGAPAADAGVAAADPVDVPAAGEVVVDGNAPAPEFAVVDDVDGVDPAGAPVPEVVDGDAGSDATVVDDPDGDDSVGAVAADLNDLPSIPLADIPEPTAPVVTQVLTTDPPQVAEAPQVVFDEPPAPQVEDTQEIGTEDVSSLAETIGDIVEDAIEDALEAAGLAPSDDEPTA